MKRNRCVLEDKDCIDCGECNFCDLNPIKICDDCMECLDFEMSDYKGIIIDEIKFKKDG
ncbi:hypothetical protein [Anoxybacter fermentans]|uniref:hypothetical protein n=1 Tax=Anoxybacter fermentans TaxID=1323375 RepID=UPI001F25981B|nr:hypothetical protein [Anoxybacter fermentans]